MKILFQDKNILAVDKPAGILVYSPLHFKGEEETLLDQVAGNLDFLKIGERTGVVHRLDRDTSGVILFAKNEEAESRLKDIFKSRKINKYYIALVRGKLESERGRISIPLGRAPKDRLKVVPKASGKPSETLYRVLKYYPRDDLSLLEVELKTGRMHQIRVHLSAIGHSVVGDLKYGHKSSSVGRQFLHAARLRFINPFDGEEVVISSDLPDELQNYLANLS